MNKIPVIFVAAALCSACEPGAASNESVVRDSAGVRIVEYIRIPADVGSVMLSAEPIYRHGVAPNDYPFQMIWLGGLQPDGSAIVVDAGAQEIVRINPNGTSYSMFASRGRGPGEVQHVSSVIVLGQDTVLIDDDGNARISIITPDDVIRSTNLAGDRSTTFGLKVLGTTSADHLLMSTSSYRSGFTEPWLVGHLVRFELDTQTADTVAWFDLAHFVAREGPQNPFLPVGETAASKGRFVTARSDRAEIKWLTADGELTQVMRWTPLPVYPTTADWEAFVDGLRTELRRVNPRLGGEQLQQFINRQIARYELNTGEPMPVFSLLHSDAEGRVWLASFDAAGPMAGVSAYTVIDHDGSWLGVIEPPATFRFLDAADGRLLGVMKDRDDVQHVVMYGIESGGS